MPPVATGVFTLPADGEPPRLLGGYCPSCDRHFFPKPKYCPACLNKPEDADLGSTGVIYNYTVVRTKPPLGLPRPYSVGYIDLDGVNLRIFCLLDPENIDWLRIGLPVRLAVGPMGHDGQGNPCLRPYFNLKA